MFHDFGKGTWRHKLQLRKMHIPLQFCSYLLKTLNTQKSQVINTLMRTELVCFGFFLLQFYCNDLLLKFCIKILRDPFQNLFVVDFDILQKHCFFYVADSKSRLNNRNLASQKKFKDLSGVRNSIKIKPWNSSLDCPQHKHKNRKLFIQ